MEPDNFSTGSSSSASNGGPADAAFGNPASGSQASTADGPSGPSTPSTPSASIGDRLADVGANMRDRAGTAKAGIADALESGAERLRGRSDAAMVPAGAAATGAVGVAATASAETAIAERVAEGMQQSADWIRDIDLDGLKSSLERQAKEHPGRTLLIAAGLGYLIGKAFRR